MVAVTLILEATLSVLKQLAHRGLYGKVMHYFHNLIQLIVINSSNAKGVPVSILI